MWCDGGVVERELKFKKKNQKTLDNWSLSQPFIDFYPSFKSKIIMFESTPRPPPFPGYPVEFFYARPVYYSMHTVYTRNAIIIIRARQETHCWYVLSASILCVCVWEKTPLSVVFIMWFVCVITIVIVVIGICYLYSRRPVPRRR